MKKLLLIALLLIGCGGTTNTNDNNTNNNALDQFHPAFDRIPLIVKTVDTNSEKIEQSIRFWNEASGKEIFLYSHTEDYDIKIEFTDSMNNVENENVLAMAHNIETNKCDIIAKSTRYSLLAHELGHCLGYTHSSDFFSVMYPIVPDDSQITAVMKAELLDYINSF